jgi:hypothetical protein
MHSIEPLLVSDTEVQTIADAVIERSSQIVRFLHPETLKAVAHLCGTRYSSSRSAY